MRLLNIKQVKWRNFRSYGDYDTVLPIEGLGPALIVGMTNDDPTKSNGAGKSTIADIILWILFGRVPTNHKPADSIVNWDSGKDCIGELITTDGYIITRTRNVDGHDDLLIHSPDGQDISDSTNTNAQQHLNRLFDLDYDIFTSNIFFGQFCKPFLELPDLKRKKALERMLHLTKFDTYVEVAKEKLASIELEQAKYNADLGHLDGEIIRISREMEQHTDEFNAFETNRATRIETARQELTGVDAKYADKASELQAQLNKAKEELEAIHTYDIVQLQKEWDAFNRKSDKINSMNDTVTLITNQISQSQSERTTLHGQKSGVDASARIDDLTEQLAIAEDELQLIKTYDQEQLAKEWQVYISILNSINEIEGEVNRAGIAIAKLTATKEEVEKDIKAWEAQEGKVCPTCRQVVHGEHVHEMVTPSSKRLPELEGQITAETAEIDRLSGIKEQLQAKAKPPVVSLAEATAAQSQYDGKVAEIGTIKTSIEQFKQQQEQHQNEAKKRQARIQQLDTFIKQKEAEKQRKLAEIGAARQSLENSRPGVTVSEAQLIQKQYEGKGLEIRAVQSAIAQLDERKEQAKEDIRAKIRAIGSEINPYRKLIDQMSESLNAIKEKRASAAKRVQQYDQLIRHVDYIRSAYSDRRKVKAFMLSRMVPYLNERIAYYLSALECNFTLELNAFLQAKSKRWPYDQCSGGQRRSIDLAMMFAIYDLHTSIYEQRCNLLVLDEVDGRLDVSTINKFVDLLYKDFIPQKKTILVISHRDEMRDAFPTKINVKMVDELSYIEEVR
jgi:DNA repair exonuclease SbcCD ATPase subunit